jgi:hypothetical protein
MKPGHVVHAERNHPVTGKREVHAVHFSTLEGIVAAAQNYNEQGWLVALPQRAWDAIFQHVERTA